AGRRDRRRLRRRRGAQGRGERRWRQTVRIRLDVARLGRDGPCRQVDAEPGHTCHGRWPAAPRDRRLGARLLPQLPEPPSRLSRGVVERRQLGCGGRALRGCAVKLTAAGGGREEARSMKERMLSGELYLADDPELAAAHARGQELLEAFNATAHGDRVERERLLRELLGAIGEGVVVKPPFRCDYGRHIEIGARTFVHYNCV